MTLHMVVHGVLALKRASAILVLAHKMPSSVLKIVDSHLELSCCLIKIKNDASIF